MIFSDETYIDVDVKGRSQYVRREKKAPIRDAHTTSHRPYRQRLLFWGCFSGTGNHGCLVHQAGTMNAPKYIEVLRRNLLPHISNTFRRRGLCYFMQDNAPCHKAKSTMEFCRQQGLRLLDWPPYSPDLNPIENVWAALKREIHKSPCATVEEVKCKAQEAWQSSQMPGTMQSLIESMPKRIADCIKASGGPTKY